jgi:hypothetical protein
VTANLGRAYKGKVSMVCDGAVPMERYFGYDIGAMLLNEHEKNGVKIYAGKDVMKLSYKEGKYG